MLDPDEGRNAEKAREILLLGDWVTPHQNFVPTLDKPIFFYWLLALSFKLFGLSEWSARLPNALASLGCVFLVYRFARAQFGLWPALWSGLILITSLEFFLLSRIVLFEMTLTLFITLGLFSFYDVAQNPEPRWRKVHAVIMYAAIGAGTLVKGPIALVVPGMVVFSYLLFTRKWHLLSRLHLLFGAGVTLTIVVPWYAWVEIANPGYLYYFLWEEHFVRYLTPHHSRSEAWYYFFLVLGVGFLPWTLFLPRAAKSLCERTLTDVNLFLVLWLLVPFVFFSASYSKLPHYLLPIYPALAVLVGQMVAARIPATGMNPFGVLFSPAILTTGLVIYLAAGAVWPQLLPIRLSSFVPQKSSLIGLYGAAMAVVFGVFIAGSTNAWRDQRPAFTCTAVGLALFLMLTGQLIPAASAHRTSKSLAEVAAPLIEPEHQIVLYSAYFGGLPFYLAMDRPMWVVQSREKGEVMDSFYVAQRRPAPAAGHRQVLFAFEEFAEEWKKNELAFRVFLKEKDLPRLSSNVGVIPKTLMRFHDVVLVSNR
ncbi:MAG TPA: glycosyltransferase family 39 protein [Candidatus Binatia bacterium]|nr:glycosyltransferase family 39 protein [Candidatus Binatia bacterium]